MNAIEIFKKLIGERLTPLIVKYDPYKDVFTTHPYRHIFDDNFERTFSADVRTFGICSDETAGQIKKKKRSDEDAILVQMPIPATTDVNKISNEYKRFPTKINIFFSTYQSIDVVSQVAGKNDINFDIAVCDEAHRTIGAYKQNDDETSNFVKIHDDSFIQCKKRLYLLIVFEVFYAKSRCNLYSYDPIIP